MLLALWIERRMSWSSALLARLFDLRFFLYMIAKMMRRTRMIAMEDSPVEKVAQLSWMIGESADWLMIFASGASALTDLSSWLELNQEPMLLVRAWIALKESEEIVLMIWEENSVLFGFWEWNDYYSG